MAVYKAKELRKLLGDYNKSVEKADQIDVNAVLAALTKEGAGVPALAAEISFEKIEAAGVPAAMARAIGRLWRQSDKKEDPAPAPAAPANPLAALGGSDGVADLVLAIGNVAGLSDRVLLANYEPMGRDDVTSELNKRANKRPFIVFGDKSTMRVDVDRSFSVLQLIKQGVDVGLRTSVDNKLVELFRAGELPDMSLSICPVHGVHLVGEGEFCPKCNRGWAGISTEIRELAYMQVQEVLAEEPKSSDPRLAQIFAATADAGDAYWSEASLQRDKRRDTGVPIVLVKPVERRRSRS